MYFDKAENWFNSAEELIKVYRKLKLAESHANDIEASFKDTLLIETEGGEKSFKNPVSYFDSFLWERYNGDLQAGLVIRSMRFWVLCVQQLKWFPMRCCCCCCCCCCCLHIKSRSGLYSVLSNIRTGPTDADAFRGHRLTTQKGYTHQKDIKGPRKVNTHAII